MLDALTVVCVGLGILMTICFSSWKFGILGPA
jgi:hypothetical protein